MKIDLKKQEVFILILIFPVVSVLLFQSTLSHYFFQDDWFNFNITNIHTLGDYLSFFSFRDDIIAYRPVGLQTFFFVFRTIFGLNAYALRVINFSLLILTYLLIIRVGNYLLNGKIAPIFVSALWILSHVQYMNLGAINYNLLGTLFWLISFNLFLTFTKNTFKKYYFLSLGFFIFTLGIFELSTILPLIMFLYLVLVIKKDPITSLKLLTPFIFTSIIFIIIRQHFIATLPIEEYKISLGIENVKNLFWYCLWLFNVPEEFKKQAVSNLVVLNDTFLRDYWSLVFKIFTTVSSFIMISIIYPIYTILKQKKLPRVGLYVFCLAWFLIALTPALLLVNHNFIMYLTLASIPAYILIADLIFSTGEKKIIVTSILIWVLISSITVDFYKKNFFWVEAQKTSRHFISNLSTNLPYIPSNSVLYYPLYSQEEIQAVFKENAAQAFYRDNTIKVFFDKRSLESYIQENKPKNETLYIYKI